MQEKNYYNLINKYYEKNATESMAWESKLTRADNLSFGVLPPHQEEALLRAERVLTYKIPDSGLGKKPMDGFVLYRAKAVVIAIYDKPRATQVFEIPIRAFLKEKYTSTAKARGFKSLSKARASEIGKLLKI